MSLPLEGVKVVDFTCVQSGPSSTQLMAFYGADVLKIEMPGEGDTTRSHLRDIPDADALYFTMLNCSKKSLELDGKSEEGKEILRKLLKEADVFVENFGPGALDRMGFSYEEVKKINPGIIYGSIKGFNGESPYYAVKAYENVAQSAGGACSTTGWWPGVFPIISKEEMADPNIASVVDRLTTPLVSAAALGDSNTGNHLLIGILTALVHKMKTGEGQKVTVSMQDSTLNLCRVKLRDQQRLARLGELTEYPQYPHEKFGDATPRGGNAGGGGEPGWILKCKGSDKNPDAAVYFTLQDHAWAAICKAVEKPEWVDSPAYNTREGRQPHIFDIFNELQSYIINKGMDKFEAVKYFGAVGIPCGPVLSMKEIAEDESLRKSGTIVEVDHPVRGKFLTVGSPMKFSGFEPRIESSPILGANNEEVLKGLGYSDAEIAGLREKKVIIA